MATWMPPLAFIALLIIVLDAVYRKGHRDGYRAAVATEPPALPLPPMNLEALEVQATGKVYWRYGEGRTELTGYCAPEAFPAEALETVAAHLTLKEEQRHLDAADELVDNFLATHGPFREGPFRNLDHGL